MKQDPETRIPVVLRRDGTIWVGDEYWGEWRRLHDVVEARIGPHGAWTSFRTMRALRRNWRRRAEVGYRTYESAVDPERKRSRTRRSKERTRASQSAAERQHA